MEEPVYIAGCYRAKNRVQKIKNILHANAVAQRFAELGIIYFSPISHTALFDEACPDVSQEYWLELGAFWQERCRSIFLLTSYQESIGAISELKRAKELKQGIFYEEPHPGIEFAKEGK